jgi:hypothetical protein
MLEWIGSVHGSPATNQNKPSERTHDITEVKQQDWLVKLPLWMFAAVVSLQLLV